MHTGGWVNPINREGRNIVTCSPKPLMHFKNTCTKNYADTYTDGVKTGEMPLRSVDCINVSILVLMLNLLRGMKDVAIGELGEGYM